MEACGYVDYSPTTDNPDPCPNLLPCPDHGDPSGRLYRHALVRTTALLAEANQARAAADKYGGDTTYGDQGLTMAQLAPQLAAEAQAWATLAQTLVIDLQARLAAGGY